MFVLIFHEVEKDVHIINLFGTTIKYGSLYGMHVCAYSSSPIISVFLSTIQEQKNFSSKRKRYKKACWELEPYISLPDVTWDIANSLMSFKFHLVVATTVVALQNIQWGAIHSTSVGYRMIANDFNQWAVRPVEMNFGLEDSSVLIYVRMCCTSI